MTGKINYNTAMCSVTLALLLFSCNNSAAPPATVSGQTPPASQSDPVEIYAASIRAGKYSLKPRGVAEGKTRLTLSFSGQVTAATVDETDSNRAASGYNSLSTIDSGPQNSAQVTAIWLNIKEVQFISSSEARKVVLPSRYRVNLLELRDDVTTLFNRSVPAGNFDQIRLLLESDNGTVTRAGSDHPLTVPSGSETGLKLTGAVEILSGLITGFKLNFEIESLKFTPGSGFILRPTIAIEKVSTALPFIHGTLFVKFRADHGGELGFNQGRLKSGIDDLDEILKRHNLVGFHSFVNNDFELGEMDDELVRELGLNRVFLFYFEERTDIIQAMFDLIQHEATELVFPDQILELAAAPNDEFASPTSPLRFQESYLSAINAYAGWDLLDSAPAEIQANLANLKIGVFDAGIDFHHPDLWHGSRVERAPQQFYHAWCNEGEPDEHRCIQSLSEEYQLDWDDLFYDGAYKTPNNYHGTAVASLIGAARNNSRQTGFGFDYSLRDIAAPHDLATGGDESGMVGINPYSKIIDFNVGAFLEHDMRVTQSIVTQSLILAANLGVDVINMSFGAYGYEYVDCYSNTIFTFSDELGGVRYANRRGVVLVASAGNEPERGGLDISSFPGGMDPDNDPPGYYPASFPEVIAVSALSTDGAAFASGYSNYSFDGVIDVAAPGGGSYRDGPHDSQFVSSDEHIIFAVPFTTNFGLHSYMLFLEHYFHPFDNYSVELYCNTANPVNCHSNRFANWPNYKLTGYNFGGGTSLAAPMVAGLASLIRGVYPEANPATVRDIIRATADPIPDDPVHNHSAYIGAGRINVGAAIQKVMDDYNLGVTFPQVSNPCSGIGGEPPCFLDDGHSFQFTATGGVPPYTWEIAGDYLDLISDSNYQLDASSGLLVMPSQYGVDYIYITLLLQDNPELTFDMTFYVTVRDSNGNATTRRMVFLF